MKKVIKSIKILLLIILSVFLLCVLQYAIHYYSHPFEKQRETVITTGYLVLDQNARKYEKVDVEIRSEELIYIYGNKDNGIQGDIWVNGQRLFGSIEIGSEGYGFYTAIFPEKPEYSVIHFGGAGSICKCMCISPDLNTIVCGINADSSISKTITEPTEALLIVGAEDKEDVIEQLQKVSTHPAMERWLKENEWNIE